MSELKCPECGATEGDLMGHKVQGVYDGVLYWVCQKCGWAWARVWEEGSRRYYKARELVEAWNTRSDQERVPRADP